MEKKKNKIYKRGGAWDALGSGDIWPEKAFHCLFFYKHVCI
jgi:hypothetical protein